MPNVPHRVRARAGHLGAVVYDANVLFSQSLSYLLLRLAERGLVQPKFSDTVLFEAGGSIASRYHFSALADFATTLKQMESFVRDNDVRNFLRWVPHINDMRDKGDMRVLATAIQGGAWLIVTNNLKDFPAGELRRWGIEAESADDFLCRCFDANATMVVTACARHPRGGKAYLRRLATEAPRAAGLLLPYLD